MDIKSFTNLDEARGAAGSLIRSEKWENHKNSTHTKIKFYIIFFFRWILKILIWEAKGLARGGQGALSIQKNKKITRTVPILKPNST